MFYFGFVCSVCLPLQNLSAQTKNNTIPKRIQGRSSWSELFLRILVSAAAVIVSHTTILKTSASTAIKIFSETYSTIDQHIKHTCCCIDDAMLSISQSDIQMPF
jgi:hypothetical protein